MLTLRRFAPGSEPLESRELLAGVRQPTGASIAAPSTPPQITLHLASAPAGDYVDVTAPRVILAGMTDPGATVVLARTAGSGASRVIARKAADPSGNYRFAVACGTGETPFTVRAATAAGGRAASSLTVTRANEVVAWNSVALQAARAAHLQAPDAARDLAIAQLSVFDAVDAIDPRYEPYASAAKKPAGPPSAVAASAAAAAAAETSLAGLFPGQAVMLKAQLGASLATLPAGTEATRGISLGVSAANRMLALRGDDGSGVAVRYAPGDGPDSWVPTPPAYAPPVDSQWGRVTPFALTSGTQFQPPPPPAVGSAEFAADVGQVEEVGGAASTARTTDQTAAARFWSDLAGTFDPPGHWNQIAEIAAGAEHSGLEASAHTFALLDMALADAGIEAWGVKYAYSTARPVTVIRDGADGANPGVAADPAWTPLWSTPAFPSYISGHSTFSAAAAAVLDSAYGPSFAFSDPGDPSLHLAPRHFAGFDQAAQEAGMSRIYGGIHFMSDNLGGLQVGGEVGRFVVRNSLLPAKVPMPGSAR